MRGRIRGNLCVRKIGVDSDWASQRVVEFHAERFAIDTSPIATSGESVWRASQELLERSITTGDMKRSSLPCAWSRWLLWEDKRRGLPVVGAE